jgi:hypothetical protein
VRPNVRAKVGPAVWRAGTAAQNWGRAPAPQAQCATPLGLTLSEGLGRTSRSLECVVCYESCKRRLARVGVLQYAAWHLCQT